MKSRGSVRIALSHDGLLQNFLGNSDDGGAGGPERCSEQLDQDPGPRVLRRDSFQQFAPGHINTSELQGPCRSRQKHLRHETIGHRTEMQNFETVDLAPGSNDV